MESFVRSLALSTGRPLMFGTAPGVGNTTWGTTTPSTSSELVANRSSTFSRSTTPNITITNGISASQVANISALATSNSTTTANPYFNGTDLNNATQCWPAYWSYSSMTRSWSQAHRTTVTRTVTYTSTIQSGVPEPSLNATYSILCDGLPRFDFPEEADNATVLLPTPITTVSSYLTVNYIQPTGENFPPSPSCSVRNADECSAAWSLFASSLASSNSAWSTSNILTVSLASPPTSVVVNSRETPLTAPPGTYPVLTLHGEEYGADEGTYTISGGTNLYGEVTLTPGGRQILTWDRDQILRPFGPTVGNCTRPSGSIIQDQCTTARCTVAANSVELLYFPPPSASRDLCANTSPGFNSYSVSIFSHPHSSTIINSTTFWYDKAYVRYDTVSAYKFCSLDNGLGATQVPVGGTYSKHLVEISSSDLSSICGIQYNPTRPYGLVIAATAKPFNFEDLVGDIPASAYQCMPRCNSACENIVSSWWVPGLAVPPQVRAEDPEWASCVPQFDGVPDPPIALGSVPNFLTTSTRSEPRPTSAPTPGQTITTGASATVLPITQPTITTRFTSTITMPTSRPGPNNPEVSVNPNPDDPRPSISRPNDPAPNNPAPNNPAPNNPAPNNPAPNNPAPNNPALNNPALNNPAPNNPALNNPALNNPAPNDPLPNDLDPATSRSPSPQEPNNGPRPITRPSAGPTPIGTIGNSIINTDPSHPGTIIISDPNRPGGAATLTAGSDPIVISGTTISVDPTSSVVVVSGELTLQPVGIVNGKPVFTDPNQSGVIIVGDPDSGQPVQTLSQNGPSAVVVDETPTLPLTAAVQASTTISGLSIAVLSDGTVLVDNTHAIRPGDPEIFVNGHKVVVDSNGVVWVDDQRVQTFPLSGDPSGDTIAPQSTPTASIRTDSHRTDSTVSETKDDPRTTTPEDPQNTSAAGEVAMVPFMWELVCLGLLMMFAV